MTNGDTRGNGVPGALSVHHLVFFGGGEFSFGQIQVVICNSDPGGKCPTLDRCCMCVSFCAGSDSSFVKVRVQKVWIPTDLLRLQKLQREFDEERGREEREGGTLVMSHIRVRLFCFHGRNDGRDVAQHTKFVSQVLSRQARPP